MLTGLGLATSAACASKAEAGDETFAAALERAKHQGRVLALLRVGGHPMTKAAVNARYLLDPALHARAQTSASQTIADFLNIAAQAKPRPQRSYDGRIGAELYDASKRLLIAIYVAESGDGELNGSTISLPSFPIWFHDEAQRLEFR